MRVLSIILSILSKELYSAFSEGSSVRSNRFNQTALKLLNEFSDKTHTSLQDMASYEAFRKMLIGCWDTELILPALSIIGRMQRRREQRGVPLVFVDGGANIGKVTGSIFSMFANIPFRAFSYLSEDGLVVDRLTRGVTCPERVDTIETIVISVEAQRYNYERLVKNSYVNNWKLDGFFPVNKALTNTSGDFVLFEHSCSPTIDEVARIVNSEGVQVGACHSQVETVSIASLLDNLKIGDWSFRGGPNQVFLVKLDIEGQEPFVIASILTELTNKTIKFLTFEFIADWKSPGGLDQVLFELWRIRFFCFLILPDQLVPVSGPYWNPLARKHWTNFFCGSIYDEDLRRVINVHNSAFDSDLNTFIDEFLNQSIP